MVPSVETAAGIAEKVQPYLKGRVFAIDLASPGRIDTEIFDREVLSIGDGSTLKWIATFRRVWMFPRGFKHADMYDMLQLDRCNDAVLSAGLYEDLDIGRTFGEDSSTLAERGILPREASNRHKIEILGPQLGSDFRVVDKIEIF